MKRNRHTLPFLKRITLVFLTSITKFLFPLKLIGKEKISHIREPLVLVGNHVANWDPIWIIAAFGEPPRFLATDLAFRRPVLGRLLRWSGTISKRKFHADPRSVRNMKQAIAQKDWVGFYPEGEATWTGQLAPFVAGTGKLLQFLNTPVVCIRSSGCYFSQNRWLRKKHRTPVTLEITKVIEKQNLRSYTGTELEHELRNALDTNPWETESTIARLDGIERALAYCPNCSKSHTLVSSLKTLKCTACNAEARLTKSGELHWKNSSTSNVPNTIPQWFLAQDRWMLEKGAAVWKNLELVGKFQEHSSTKGIKFSTPITVTWTDEGQTLVIKNTKNQNNLPSQWNFSWDTMKGVNVQMGERLEFRIQERIFIVQFSKTTGSYPLYRWYTLIYGGKTL